MRISKAKAKALGIDLGDFTAGTDFDRKGRRKSKSQPKPVKPSPFALLCVEHGLPLPEEESPFHPTRKWQADYVFGGLVVVEKDGGLYGRGPKCPTCGRRGPGAHSSITQMLADRERDRETQIAGYIVLRFPPEDFETGACIPTIKRALEEALS